MDRKEILENFIESIGFKYDSYSYLYKNYQIDLYKNYNNYYNNYYNFHNGSEWTWGIPLNDITLLENEFKHELRSIKLKKILG